MVRFDAYSATTSGVNPLRFIELAMRPGDEVKQGKGFHTFGERAAIKDASGDEVASVMWGGRQGDRVMIEVKGVRTPEAVERLRSDFPHRCTRVDSCADFERPGAFEELLEPVLKAKADFRLYGERRGDWEFPELGRSQYLGANSSAVRARLYEKGKQPEYRHLNRPNLCRLEIQIRPQKDAKTVYAELSATQVWGASKWTRQLAADGLKTRSGAPLDGRSVRLSLGQPGAGSRGLGSPRPDAERDDFRGQNDPLKKRLPEGERWIR
jgi:hypothetical protein